MNSPRFAFTVDTHLFRELGELLVGRDSTALVELIKNSYDADATRVRVRAQGLLTKHGTISVTDDGIGMTPEIFQTAFLRIAGRYKEGRDRRSPLYRRQYTGAKGVGRLSAHKLAQHLNVISYPDPGLHNGEETVGVRASIDWEALEERASTLDDVGDALRVETIRLEVDQGSGTTLQLKDVRGKWTPKKLHEFVQEVSACLAPSELTDPPAFPLTDPQWSLGAITPWTQNEDDPGFEIKLEGDLNIGEPLWADLIARSNWLLEIDASPDGVRFGIHPAPVEIEQRGSAQSYFLRREHPDPAKGPFFVARIYTREGPIINSQALSDFANRHSGIRMYMEGFRVVPYGDSHDDWLGLNRDYVRRVREFEQVPLDEWTTDLLPKLEAKPEGFRIRGNRQYIGGVFLTAQGGASLRPVVNREGFLQDEAFEILRTLVRNGVDLLIRAQAATAQNRATIASPQKVDENAGTLLESAPPRSDPNPPGHPLPVVRPGDEEPTGVVNRRNLNFALTRASYELTQIKGSLDGIDGSLPETVSRQLEEAAAAVSLAKESAAKDESDYAMLQVLAGVGLQFAAFVHEVNGLLSQAQQVRKLADAIPASASSSVLDLRISSDVLCQSLARQASYLTEVVGPDARRRRRRIPLVDAPRTSLQLLETAIRERAIEVKESLEESTRTPPIFPAELTIIFTNLLTNAVKAAGQNGQILITGKATEAGGVEFRVENTGVQVDLASSERWFRPFESTTTEVDVLLGQGMGLGLSITRRIVAEYSGRIRFIEPSAHYSTAIAIDLPSRKGN